MSYRKILKQIKKYDTIVIARHVGADPDALGSSLGLKDIILENFPKKKVYVVGTSASKFKYFGNMDKISEDVSHGLLIVTDTPDYKRVDGTNPANYAYKIKIDHHPFIEKYCDLEVIDDTASSVSQMIIEFALKCHLKIPTSAANKLFLGLIGDTGRFLYDYTTTKTFDLVSKLIKKTKINFTSLYQLMYLRPINDYRFFGYLFMNLIVTENKVAYIKLDDKTLKEHNVDAATPSNLINDFSSIEEALVTVFFSEDVAKGYIKCSIRSRGPIINEVASHYNGGGHTLSSGARLKSFEEADQMIKELESVCKDYLSE